jgi:antitoxin component YwqK of YwqJK toxin-antitoxin module
MRKKLLLLSILVCSALLHAELFTENFEDGAIKSQVEYIKGTRTATNAGIKHGFEKVYYNTGQLAFEVHNKEGKRDGALHWYDREGNHLEVMHFQKGKRHGINKIFFANGTLRIEVNYINDKKEGPEKFYFSTGELASEVTFINDKQEGLQKEYNLDGTLNNDVMYKNGFKEGEKRWYDKHGKIIKTELYKRDRPVNLMKKIRAKKAEQTIESLQGLNFNPNNRKIK